MFIDPADYPRKSFIDDSTWNLITMKNMPMFSTVGKSSSEVHHIRQARAYYHTLEAEIRDHGVAKDSDLPIGAQLLGEARG